MGAAMESRAILRRSGHSASKMRQVADLIRGKDVDVALHTLRFVTNVVARPMEKLITSAVANAREKANAADVRFDADAFFVKTVMVDEGRTLKRFRPRAQGRAYGIRKRSCQVQLVLESRETKPESARRAAAKTGKAERVAKPAKADKPAKAEAKTEKAAKGAKAAPKKAAEKNKPAKKPAKTPKKAAK
jgi:large subunit ribosomal protein L22